jgi:hypothetical protein
MTVTAPERTTEQRMAALAQANVIRKERKVITDALWRGEIGFRDVDLHHRAIEGMAVGDLLAGLPWRRKPNTGSKTRCARVHSDRLLRSLGIALTKACGRLTVRETVALRMAVAERCPSQRGEGL